MKRILLLISLLLTTSWLHAAETNRFAFAESHMQAQAWGDAVKALNTALKDKGGDRDYGKYLKALALHHQGRHDACIKLCRGIEKAHPKSDWLRKARFLQARTLIKERRHEEANKIYEAEALRLFAGKRKENIARILLEFGDELARTPGDDELDAPPPNFDQARQLYERILGMDVDRTMQDDVRFKAARMWHELKNWNQAAVAYRNYLAEFDPTWAGPVGSPERFRGQLKTNPPPAGAHRLDARFYLVEAQLALCNQVVIIKKGMRHQEFKANAQGQSHLPMLKVARQNIEDLIVLLEKEKMGNKAITADTRWLKVRSYNLPLPAPIELEAAIKAGQDFIKAHPRHPRATDTARLIALTWTNQGRTEEAIAAYQDFVAGKGFEFVPEDGEHDPEIRTGVSCSETFDQWTKGAVYEIGQLRFGQKKYSEAILQWERYIGRFPNGPHWSQCQSGIINASFKIGLEAVSNKAYGKAKIQFDTFLKQYPLDTRSRQILFILGQMHYAEAQELVKAEGDDPDRKTKVTAAYQNAVDEWSRLVSKYPNTEESSLALFRMAQVGEENLGDLDQALASYLRLKWGSWAGKAQQRVQVMTKHELKVETERSFRSNEEATITLRTRNVEKVTISRYPVNLEAYFRKTHRMDQVDALDVDLIEADKTWEVEIKDYAKYKPSNQQIVIPFPEGDVGACIIKVQEEDYQATTLVVRSDLDFIMKSTRKEAIVFVEDQLKGTPAAGVNVLVSDGKKIVATGVTGKDGVYREKIPSLKEQADLRIFIQSDRGVASTSQNLGGLNWAGELGARGYLYSDKPTYRPGEKVNFRAIVRDAKEGSFIIPEQREYRLHITDPEGRLIEDRTVSLSDFGTFDGSLKLAEMARVGSYSLKIFDSKNPQLTWAMVFQVQRYKLERMKLEMDFSQPVYFRGETIKATLVAKYYWGTPVANQRIRYTLPDGRNFSELTDAAGKLEIQYDASGNMPGSWLNFSGEVEGENVRTQKTILLAALGFNLTSKTSQQVALAGEPFDLEVSSLRPDQSPTGQTLEVVVVKNSIVQANPVLSQVPWLSREIQTYSEETISKHKLSTDPKTGKGRLTLKLDKGGPYLIRVTGTDRFDQKITHASSITISDDADDTRLRFFAEKSRWQVGEALGLRLHARLDPTHALLTFEGDTILEHRVIKLKKGFNAIKLDLDHEHFPNFRASVACLDGRHLRLAAKDFQVDRKLKITLEPEDTVRLPGAKTPIKLTVTDQLDRPVQAELSLSLVNRALLDLYPETRPEIISFFQQGQYRQTASVASHSSGFRYDGITREVIKSIEDEAKRIQRRQNEQVQLRQLQQTRYGYYAIQPGQNAAPQELDSLQRMENLKEQNQEAAQQISLNGIVFAGQKNGNLQLGVDQSGFGSGGTLFTAHKGRKAGPGAQKRREHSVASRWIVPITTDANGKASITMALPELPAEWELQAIGCTKESLVGETEIEMITRKDFFVELKLPNFVQENDELEVIGRIHNMTDFEGPATVTLNTPLSGENKKSTVVVDIKKQSVTEVLFERFRVPAGEKLKLRCTAKAGEHRDKLLRKLPIRPWGLEYRARLGGLADQTILNQLKLPEGQRYTWKKLVLFLSPRIEQSLIDLALHNNPVALPIHGRPNDHISPPHGERDASSELLGSVSGLEYARGRKIDQGTVQQILDRARALSSELVTTQNKDGSWSFGRGGKDWALSTRAYWALASARRAGIPVPPDTLDKAKTYLMSVFQKTSSQDNESKAVIMFALSTNNEADFSAVNRLYRERSKLSSPALARLAATFANLDRKDTALELLTLLESKRVVSKTASGQALVSWPKGGNVWSRDQLETTAFALMVYASAKPNAPEAKAIAETLIHHKGCFDFASPRLYGSAMAALTAWFGPAEAAAADYEVDVMLNDKKIRTVKSSKIESVLHIAIPADTIKDSNTLRFDLRGKGTFHYAATLSGFSPEMKNPKSFGRNLRVEKRVYYHDRLSYRNVKLKSASSTQVKNLEVGQRIRIFTDTYYYSSRVDDYLIREEYFPAGTVIVPGSVSKGGASWYEIGDGKITFYYPRGAGYGDVSFEVVAYAPGTYKILPTVFRSVYEPGRMVIGPATTLNVLKPGEKSGDKYAMNRHEHYEFANLNFNDGNWDEALKHLDVCFNSYRRYYEKDAARMLLWIYTQDKYFDEKKVVQLFEVLRERHPDLFIPFDKILAVGKAYRLIGEFERAWLVFRATIDSSFISDTSVSAVLEDMGQFLGSMTYLERLWYEYPDRPTVTTSYLAWANALYDKAPQAEALSKQQRNIKSLQRGEKSKKANRIDFLAESVSRLNRYLVMYGDNPQADDAAFAMVNSFFSLEDYKAVVRASEDFRKRYSDGSYKSSFEYMAALGYFWQHQYNEALDLAIAVANGKSKDRDYSRYITAQIYHTQGKPEDAITWYEKVKTIYPDASDSIDYFNDQKIGMEEVSTFKPGEAVELKLDYRNIKEAFIQVYKVDLMKLYLREKNLSKITQINLAGISPELEVRIPLGDGKDYRDKEHTTKLDLKEDGAYLVICRGDNLFTSGLTLITPLKLEIQEDPGTGGLRVNVIDRTKGGFVSKVHVKAIGSHDSQFKSGDTDLRGIFAAEGLNGVPTVIVRDKKSRYAFYRGTNHLGKAPNAAPIPQTDKAKPGSKQLELNDYLGNQYERNIRNNGEQIGTWDALRRGGKGGVQIKSAK